MVNMALPPADYQPWGGVVVQAGRGYAILWHFYTRMQALRSVELKIGGGPVKLVAGVSGEGK
jgi:hypothetical protein